MLVSVSIWGCSKPQPSQVLITVKIIADNSETQVWAQPGSTVQDIVRLAKVKTVDSDRIEPGVDTILTTSTTIKVTRVSEEFYVEKILVPFERQELRNEALPEGEERLSQPGANGIKEVTYHRVYENNVLVENAAIKTELIQPPSPEVVMIGSRSTFSSVDIPGKIAYLSAGNAWLMENNTGNRNLVVSSGDLDGRIFCLSKDGKFLLFTRKLGTINTINSLWAASLTSDPIKIFDLGAKNIVHFASFDPGSQEVAYSTADWREAAPGWQANNDLFDVRISADASISSTEMILEANSGGEYGWWGTDFAWLTQSLIIYSRPDSVGIVDRNNGIQTSLLEISPLQTGGYWAWVPEIASSPDGKMIYAVNHPMENGNDAASGQEFDLVGIPLSGDALVDLVRNVGMFAYPVVSPAISTGSVDAQGNAVEQMQFSIAYLQAIFPAQSETSGYRLSVVDRDGSNPTSLFPSEGANGLEPQQVAWAPANQGSDGGQSIAAIYNGNLWIIDSASGVAKQITGDGLTNRIDWR